MGILAELRQMKRQIADETSAWEFVNCWYWNDYASDPDQDLLKAAKADWDTAPSQAFSIYLELAQRGSAVGAFWTGICYEYGHGADEDPHKADEYYYEASTRGSWIAALQRARLYAQQEWWEDCFAILEDGVSNGVYPFHYWLAWYLHKRGTDRAGYRRIDRLLAMADRAGHPKALGIRINLRTKGKMGWRRIPSGIKLFKRLRARRRAEQDDDELKGLST